MGVHGRSTACRAARPASCPAWWSRPRFVDNAFILLVAGATAAAPDDRLLSRSLAVSLAIAFAVNSVQVRNGRGHAAMHA